MSTIINLGICKPGDIAITQNGMKLIYECSKDSCYPHIFIVLDKAQSDYTKGDKLTFTQSGTLFSGYSTPFDIKEILYTSKEKVACGVELVDCQFGDLVQCRDGTTAVILNTIYGSSDVYISLKTGEIFRINSKTGLCAYNHCTRCDIVKILNKQPKQKWTFLADITIEATTREEARKIINTALSNLKVNDINAR